MGCDGPFAAGDIIPVANLPERQLCLELIMLFI